LDARWEKEERKVKGGIEKNSRQTDEGKVGRGISLRSRSRTYYSVGHWLRPYALEGAVVRGSDVANKPFMNNQFE